MIGNYFKIAWRHFRKDRFISLVNFTGLVIGMTTVLFIWKYVDYERSYDTFHSNYDNIYRVRTDRVKNGVPFMQFAAGAAGAGQLMQQNFPEVENYVKLTGSSEAVYSSDFENNYRLDNVYYAMPSLFEIFSFDLVSGDKSSALSEPFTACISTTTANKLFGNEDPIGKTFTRNGTTEYRVTGTFEDSPANSHLKYDMLLSYITFSDVFNEGGGSESSPYWDGFFTYLQLAPGTDVRALEAKIPEVIEKTYDEEARESVEFYLQPLSDIHLNSHYLFEAEVNGDGQAIRALFFIGIIVLLVAWFNYINLSTARAQLRAKEVGVRKVIGGSRKGLMTQFLVEVALLNVMALLISFVMVHLLNPFFTNLVGKDIPLSSLSAGQVVFILGAIFVIGTVLAGLYPAFLLSSFKPIAALRSSISTRKPGGQPLRQSLVVMQFIVATALIASTLLVYKQLRYMQNARLGINIDQMLILKGPNVTDSTISSRKDVFRQQVGQLEAVKGVVGSSSVPGQAFGWTAGGVTRLGYSEEFSESFHVMVADEDYASLYETELVAGRYMDEEMSTDVASCILNETGASLLRFQSPEEAVGAQIEFWNNRYKVVGVVKDFHQESPKDEVEPMILGPLDARSSPDYYSLKVSTEGLESTLASLESVWSGVFGSDPFEYFFLDDHFNKQYESDQRFAKVFSIFSGLAIFISCLGLFALVTFVIERKRKDLSIHKVLGASVTELVSLIVRDFLKLVIISLIIAIPIAYYFMDGWLKDFAFHVDIGWGIFIISAIIILLISLITVGAQSVRAAFENPVKSLRSE